MDTLTSIITTVVLGAAIGYGAVAAQADDSAFIGPPPPPPVGSGQIVEAGNTPPASDDVPVCLGCD
ncbi:MAG: hypothetical protein JOZ96_06725 [Acidobacteria bacterium]|nr:hypothetical protein [Acidobacteriota bacterium]